MSQPKPFDALRYLRAIERVRHADLTKELQALIDALGYDEHIHQFLHGDKFLDVMGMYPSDFLEFVGSIFIPVSKTAEDHVTEEALAVLNIVTEAAIKQLRQSPLKSDAALADMLQEIAKATIAAWEEEKGKKFVRLEHIGAKFTPPQARRYIAAHTKEYEALPGKEQTP